MALSTVVSVAAVAFCVFVWHLLPSNIIKNAGSHLRNPTVKASPVKVLLLTEALCPDCKRFVLEELVGTYSLLGDEVITLKLVPFGNARLNAENKTVECQHGVGECDANSFEQCTIAAYPEPSQYLPMLDCLDETLPMGRHDELFPPDPFEQCAMQAGLFFPRIQGCHGNPELAWRFQQESAGATPDYHEYVPWLEINGEYADEEGNLLKQVCTAYKKGGGSHPACDSIGSVDVVSS